MRAYNPLEPLVFSHVPKCGGNSVRDIFRHWFGANLFDHYGINALERQNLGDPPDPNGRVAVYGHFNIARGMGQEAIYPELTQCVTIFRDPWDRAISGYFYRKPRTHLNPAFAWVDDIGLEEYLSNYPYDDPKYGPPISNFLPRACTLENLDEVLNHWCVAIGVVEQMEKSFAIISAALDQPFEPSLLTQKNRSERPNEEPDMLKPAFRRRNALDYALYDFAERYVASR